MAAAFPIGMDNDRTDFLLGCNGGTRRFDHGRPFELDGEVKLTALARHALDRQAATHHLHQVFGDGQTQPGSTIAARRRSVSLPEWFKDNPQFSGSIPMPESAMVKQTIRCSRVWSCSFART